MRFSSWLSRSRAPLRKERERYRPSFDCLETRCLLATLVVSDPGDNGGANQLRQVLAAANTGDTITFSLPNPSTVTLGVNSTLTVSKSITIQGPGANALTINGNNNPGQVFQINGGLTVSMSGLTITGGNIPGVGGYGGGIINLGTLMLSNSYVTGNQAGARGGGLYNMGTLTVSSTTVSGNTAGAYGGGIFSAGTLTLTNSTLAGNMSAKAGGLFSNGADTIANSTITGNMATGGNGGGFYEIGTMATVSNTLIAGNSATGTGADFYIKTGSMVTTTFSLIGTSAGNNVANGTSGNIVGTAPLLGPLQNNGGPVPTVALLAGSAGIDVGDPSFSGLTTDERGPGFNRVINNRVDIGAFEFQPPATTTTLAASVNPARAGQAVTFTATVTPTAPGSNPIQGTVTFIDGMTTLGTVTLVNGTATLTTSSLIVGSHTISARYNGFALGNFTFTSSSASLTETINALGNSFFAVGAGAGGGPQVSVYNANTGVLVASFFAFSPGFLGGVQVAVADINGDGTADIICAAGFGGGPQVIVVDGTKLSQVQSNGQIAPTALLASFFAFAPSFNGGVNVAAAVLNGKPEIVVGAGPTGGPQVVVIDATKLSQVQSNGQIAVSALLGSFFAYAPSFTGGVRVAIGDVNGDGILDIITGPGAGGGPQVTVVDGTKLGQTQSTGQISATALLASFFAFAPGFTGGVFVSGGITGSNGQFNLIISADAGGGPQVEVLDGTRLGQTQSNGQIAATAQLASFNALPSTFTGGVRVGFNGAFGSSGKPAILTAAGPGGSPEINIFDPISMLSLSAFFALPTGFTGGSFVSG
jgi:predicted outer membrane repeat protein